MNATHPEAAGAAARTLRFLVGLNLQLQPLSDPDQIMAVTARMLGEHLDVNRCAYAEVEEDQDHFVITGDYSRGTFSIPGRFAMSAFGAEAHRLSLENVPYVVNDAESDPRVGPEMIDSYRQTDIAAVISVPLHKAGRFVAGMAVHSKTPRHWTDDEIELVTLVVNRCWESIERARTVRRLREQLELTSTITSNATQALLMMDARGYCTFVNPAAEAMFGWRMEELRDKPLHEYVHHHRPDGSAYPMAECPIDRALPENFDVREHEDVFIRRSGEFFPVLVAASPIFRDGRPASTVIEVRDITERKSAEESLRVSEQRLRLVLDSMPQKIFTATPTGDVDYFNPQWLEFTGLPFEDIKAWGWTRFIHPDDLAENVRVWQHSIATGETFQFEHRFLRADGEYRWHLSRALPVRDAAGGIMMWIGANTDVHPIKEAEKALREADRMKDEFLATLSHELRTPLTSITGWSQLLAAGQLSAGEQQVAIEAIRSSATAQAQLIEDVLDVSRITTGKMRLDLRPADLASVVEAAVATIRPAAEAKSIPLSVSLARNLGEHYVDPTRIQQVVWNLLSNAIKFSPAGAPVEVTLRGDGAMAKIEVRDRGRGIAPEFLPHIFERFRQADSSATRAHAGLGLGLSLAKELVELHGGTIRAESEPGRGACFIVRLPSTQGAERVGGKGERDAAAEHARPLAGVRVLYVDDREDARLLIATMLKHAGAEVATAESVAHALEALSRARPHVIVTDIAMPDHDGYDLIKTVHARGELRDLPVVALTAHAEHDDARRAAKAGFFAYLRKPVEADVLAETVGRAAAATAPREAERSARRPI